MAEPVLLFSLDNDRTGCFGFLKLKYQIITETIIVKLILV